MPVINHDVAPQLFQFIAERNMRAQRLHLRTVVEIGLQDQKYFRVTPEIVYDLHRAATLYLIFNPGRLRDHEVRMRGSTHEPPLFWHVEGLMDEYYQYLRKFWDEATPIHLAAYALWQLTWIHPFEDGNGRTARTLAYLMLCLKYRMWLPGRNTVLKQMKDRPQQYSDALRDADRHYKTGEVNLSKLERYLERALIRQLKSI